MKITHPKFQFPQYLREYILTAGGVVLASATSQQIHFTDLLSLILAAGLLSFIHAFLKPLLLLLSLPFIVLSMGLGIWLINAGLLLLVSQLVHGFQVGGWASALWGSLVISLFSWLGKQFFGPRQGPRSRVHVRYRNQNQSAQPRQQAPQQRQRAQPLNDDDVIDI